MDWYYWGVALFMVGLIGSSLKMRNMDKKSKGCPYKNKKYDDL